jgi:hypothetical protein
VPLKEPPGVPPVGPPNLPGGWPGLEKIVFVGMGGHGENITAALLAKVSSGGGCPRFAVGTWVLELTFLSVEFAMPAGLRRYYAS